MWIVKVTILLVMFFKQDTINGQMLQWPPLPRGMCLIYHDIIVATRVTPITRISHYKWSPTLPPAYLSQGTRSAMLNPLKGPPFLFWGILHWLLTISEGPQIFVDHIFLAQEHHCSRAQLRSSETGLPVWRPGLVTAAGAGEIIFCSELSKKKSVFLEIIPTIFFSYRNLSLTQT